MTINEMFNWVNFLANKSQSGAISPDEFNMACSVVNMDFFKLKVGLPEEYMIGGAMARQMYQVSQKITDDVKFLITKVTLTRNVSDYFALPSDYGAYSKLTYRYVDNVDCLAVASTRPIEVCTDLEYGERVDNSITYPTLKRPVANYNSLGLEILPTEITSVELTYLKIPTTPIRQYTINGNDESVYNPTGSVDFAYPKTTHNDICIRIMGYIGINIKEEFLVSMANSYKQQGQ